MMGFEARIDLSEHELCSLYAHLKRQEEGLEGGLESLLSRLEKILFQHLTIEEIERVQRTGRLERL